MFCIKNLKFHISDLEKEQFKPYGSERKDIVNYSILTDLISWVKWKYTKY